MSKFHYIAGELVSDDPYLPEPESTRGGSGPFIIPIIDEGYGGVIGWANTEEQAERIVRALGTVERSSFSVELIVESDDAADKVEHRVIAALATNGVDFDPMTVSVEKIGAVV